MGRVVVVGSINDDIVVTADRLPGAGETVAGATVAHGDGGKGANQAVAAARAGAVTAVVGAVGDDAAGERLVGGLFDAGVDVGAVAVVAGASTGTAVVTVADGENTIVVVAGANGSVGPESVADLVLAAGDVVVAQNETPMAATRAAFVAARAVGAVTVLNPAPAAPVADDVLALTDHLVVNEHEVVVVLGVAADAVVADPTVVRSVTDATVHLTLGPSGALVVAADEVVGERGRIVAVVDTTGAGDSYVGTVAAGLAAGEALGDAVAAAVEASARCVTRPGAR